jgi:hypothetical protein
MVKMILAAKKAKIHLDLPEGFFAVVTVVPHGLTGGDVWRHECDDRSVTVPKSHGTVSFEVFTIDSSQFVGQGVFAADHVAVQCDTIEVGIPFRRQGIGSWMYLQASKIFAAPVHPSANLSNVALAFWGGRKSISYNTA